MVERAQAKATEILQNHQVEPLSTDQDQELNEILWEADRVLK
jgi:trimethylamine:corrinoid methyltransferase-like protein